MSDIKGIVSDVGGVLVGVDWDPCWKKLNSIKPLQFDFSKDPTEPRRLPRSLWNIWDDFSIGEFNTYAFYRRVRDALGFTKSELSYQTFVGAWNSVLSLKDNGALLNSLIELRRQGYNTALLSNSEPIHWECIEKRYPAIKKIPLHVLSHKEGLKKPDPRFYTLALDKLALTSRECIFIDDRADFIEAGNKLGFRTIHHVSPIATLHQISEYLKN